MNGLDLDAAEIAVLLAEETEQTVALKPRSAFICAAAKLMLDRSI